MYTTRSDVTLQRPDKLRVISPGDGPASEFYYDGKTMVAFMPAENLVAVAEAPPTIDAVLEAAYHVAAIYFPFADVMVADPYGDIAKTLELAFYIGQSRVVGGTKTDMVAYAGGGVFVEMWIGAEDKLPRRARAVFRNDPLQLRHQVEFSNWKLGPAVPAGTFASARAAKAKPIPFAHPGPQAAVRRHASGGRRARENSMRRQHMQHDRQRPRRSSDRGALMWAGRGLVARGQVRQCVRRRGLLERQ